MNCPAASSGISNKDKIFLIAASDAALDLALRNKMTNDVCPISSFPGAIGESGGVKKGRCSPNFNRI